MASEKKKPMTERQRDAKIARCQKTIAELDRDLDSFARSVKWSESVQAYETRSVKWSESVQAYETRKAEHCTPLLAQRKRLHLGIKRLERAEVETKAPRTAKA